MPKRFGKGDRVRVAHSINLMPHTVLLPGEQGTVVSKIDENGVEGIEVLMDVEHVGLRAWYNRALLVSPETDNIEKLLVRLAKVAVLALTLGAGTLHAYGERAGTIANENLIVCSGYDPLT